MRRLVYILLVVFIVERSSSQTPLLIKEQNVYAYNKNVFNKYSRVFPYTEQDTFSSNKQKNSAPEDSSHIKQHIAKNTIYFELLGNGFLYSLNYDRLFLIKNQKFSLRGGLGYLPSGKGGYMDVYKLTIPLELNCLFGEKNYYEIGLGLSYAQNLFGKLRDVNCGSQLLPQVCYITEYSKAIFLCIKPLGYRFQREKGGLIVKASILFFHKLIEMNPMYKTIKNDPHLEDGIIFPFISLSFLGFSF